MKLDLKEIGITYSIQVADEVAGQKLMDVIDSARVEFGQVMSIRVKRFTGEPLTDEEEKLAASFSDDDDDDDEGE